MIRHALFIVPALALAACGGDEPLFSLTGTVENHLSAAPDDVHLYLVWDGQYLPAVAVDLGPGAAFPARFQLDVFEPPDVFPPADSLLPQDGWAIAHIVAARAGTVFSDEAGNFDSEVWLHTPGVLGVDPRHTLHYFREDRPYTNDPVTTELVTAFYHGEQTLGFHLMERKCITPEHAAEIRACLAHHPARRGIFEDLPTLRDCGSLWPDGWWARRAADDLKTELSVEMLDDPSSWRPDPSECI